MTENIDTQWQAFMSRKDFCVFLQECRSFDPPGFDRALKDDFERGCDIFRKAVIEVFLDDQFATASELH